MPEHDRKEIGGEVIYSPSSDTAVSQNFETAVRLLGPGTNAQPYDAQYVGEQPNNGGPESPTSRSELSQLPNDSPVRTFTERDQLQVARNLGVLKKGLRQLKEFLRAA